MTPAEAFDLLGQTFGEASIFDFHQDPKKDKDPWFRVSAEALPLVARFLRDDPRFAIDTLECLTGVDYPHKDPEQGRIAVVYHLYSHPRKHRLVAKVYLPRDNPELASLTSVWSVANWHERECFDLLGVRFLGHPDLRRLLLPEDWEGHPLRKDYVEKSHYHGIPTSRPNPIELLSLGKAPKPAAGGASGE